MGFSQRHVQKRGFTLLEVIIAVTIGVTLIGVGVPSFTSLVRRQEFQSEASRLTGCIQKAQEYVLTSRALPSGQPVRWSAAEITYNTATQNITCKQLLFGSSAWTALTIGLAEDQLVATETINSVSVAGFTYSTGAFQGIALTDTTRIYFGQSERGAVVRLISGGHGRPNAYSQYGNAMSLTLASPVDASQTVRIMINAIGTPIQLTSE